MHVARDGHTATLLSDGTVLVIGGEVLAPNRDMLASVERFDPIAGTWTELNALPEPRCNHTATLLADGKVLVVGGGKSNGIGVPSGLEVLTDAILYDPASGASDVIAGPAEPRHGHQAVRLPSGKVLVAGGAGNVSTILPSQGTANPQPFGNALASAEVFDPTTRSFAPVAPLQEARYAFTLVGLADGRAIASGGASYDGTPKSLATSEVFDESMGAFAAAGVFDGADRLFHAATRLADGRVLVFGGKKSNTMFLDDLQVQDPKALTWLASGVAPPPRTVANVVPTEDGGALVLGGLSCTASGCSVPTATQIVTAGGVVTAGPNLKRGRGLASATVLPDGSVLVAGGYGQNSTATAERLAP